MKRYEKLLVKEVAWWCPKLSLVKCILLNLLQKVSCKQKHGDTLTLVLYTKELKWAFGIWIIYTCIGNVQYMVMHNASLTEKITIGRKCYVNSYLESNAKIWSLIVVVANFQESKGGGSGTGKSTCYVQYGLVLCIVMRFGDALHACILHWCPSASNIHNIWV